MEAPWPAWSDVLLQFLKSDFVAAKMRSYHRILEDKSDACIDPHELGRAREGLSIFREIEKHLEKGS